MKDAIVLRPMKFGGQAWLPGETIPGAMLAAVNERVLQANYDTGFIADPDKVSEADLSEDRIREVMREEMQSMLPSLCDLVVKAVGEKNPAAAQALEGAPDAIAKSQKDGTVKTDPAVGTRKTVVRKPQKG